MLNESAQRFFDTALTGSLPSGTGSSVIKPTTSGGVSTWKVITAASTNAGVVKASAGQVYGIQMVNTAAYAIFVKLYNKATAPTVGTDVPVFVVGIPAGGRCEVTRPHGLPFAAGIAVAITKLSADTDTTVIAVGDLVGSVEYF